MRNKSAYPWTRAQTLGDCFWMEQMPTPQLLNSSQLYFTFDTSYRVSF